MSHTRSRSSVSSAISGPEKLEELTNLMRTLNTDLAQKNLPQNQKTATLERIKVLGRSVDNAEPIFSKEGIQTLCRHGLDGNTLSTSREALRCLANALFLKADTRQMFVDLGYAPKAVDRLKNENRDDEFLICRILFLTTYETDLNFDVLIDQHHLADHINAMMARYAKQYSKSSRKINYTAQDDMALSECLKLIFNITHYYPDQAVVFSKSIPHILKILFRRRIPEPPLAAPISYLINALINLDLEDRSHTHLAVNPLFPKFEPKCNAEHLINILDKAVARYRESELDQNAGPIIALIRKVFELAPDSVKRYMQWLLLPSDEERSRPLGRSDTLSSRLLRLSTSPAAPTLRESVSSLFFELSGKDATNFVQNVGYGFASGFLMTHNMPVPDNALEAWSTRGSDGPDGSGSSQSEPVNPITGQRLSAEPSHDPGPPMTEDEKEREAEKLFVLFERLKKTGVVNVQNPVEAAVQEGRIQELKD
ncbi:MAG: hypothetical protein M4579_004734 [Chaenotheca gracillima]|nr:MAG: hypothetical protein M4579_004734 [Chaenotheca gracillima]